ncbi:ABC-three component system protein [Saccharopolyspora sp. NPDC049426]|uniref:ABC-three component system protein n=1 Tax=Saccharopolyspora sp. NPDC049426 TaxID=3155652 RepID=UPI003436CBD9
MVEAGNVADEDTEPVFQGIPEPCSSQMVLLAPAMQGAPQLTPRQYLYHYSDDEWEEFTVEWVRALQWPYVLVQRMGGSGDRGADVAACLTRQGTNGDWHCYQCKHYSEPLRPSEAWPEMVKIFAAKVQGVYELPSRYIFVAPRISSSLSRHLANPATLKKEFFKAWNNEGAKKLGAGLSPGDRAAVESLARETDFSMFAAPDIAWILDLHSSTPHHARRFPKPLKERPAVEGPPADQREHEAVYVQKLLAVYNEKFGLQLKTIRDVRDDARLQGHFTRQREAFYSAEALRVFARESVPDETYTAVEKDLYETVVEVEELEYELGFERLQNVLKSAAEYKVNSGNILAPYVTAQDRKGLCHHLANDGRLTWCKEDPL